MQCICPCDGSDPSTGDELRTHGAGTQPGQIAVRLSIGPNTGCSPKPTFFCELLIGESNGEFNITAMPEKKGYRDEATWDGRKNAWTTKDLTAQLTEVDETTLNLDISGTMALTLRCKGFDNAVSCERLEST